MLTLPFPATRTRTVDGPGGELCRRSLNCSAMNGEAEARNLARGGLLLDQILASCLHQNTLSLVQQRQKRLAQLVLARFCSKSCSQLLHARFVLRTRLAVSFPVLDRLPGGFYGGFVSYHSNYPFNEFGNIVFEQKKVNQPARRLKRIPLNRF